MYKLLTFNDNWADEHDVPALAVMTDEEYNKWLETPSGELNSKYEEQKILYDKYEERKKEIINIIKKEGYWSVQIPIDRRDLEDLWTEYCSYPYSNPPYKVYSHIQANLGNGGECFGEDYHDLYLMKEFVENGSVEVFSVSEEFAEIFKKANLASLSLSNIFEPEDFNYCEYKPH